MRQPGQKAVTGRVASHTLNRFQTAGPHALYVPWNFNDSDRKRGVIMRQLVLQSAVRIPGEGAGLRDERSVAAGKAPSPALRMLGGPFQLTSVNFNGAGRRGCNSGRVG